MDSKRAAPREPWRRALRQSASPLPSPETETSILLVALVALAVGAWAARAQPRCRPWWILAVWQQPLTP